jgi:Chlorophyllase
MTNQSYFVSLSRLNGLCTTKLFLFHILLHHGIKVGCCWSNSLCQGFLFNHCCCRSFSLVQNYKYYHLSQRHRINKQITTAPYCCKTFTDFSKTLLQSTTKIPLSILFNIKKRSDIVDNQQQPVFNQNNYHKNKKRVVTKYDHIIMTRAMFLSVWKVLISCFVCSCIISKDESRIVNAFQISPVGSRSGDSSSSSSSSFMNTKSTLPFNSNKEVVNDSKKIDVDRTVVYKPLIISIHTNNTTNTNIPVACWFPYKSIMTNDFTWNNNGEMMIKSPAVYRHRISIRRIGQLLVGWDWIPSFASKDYNLPTSGRASTTTVMQSGVDKSQQKAILNVIDGEQLPLPIVNSNNRENALPVILLAHGYLGSRYDLSHLAEELASNGFICLSVEYPESLAASYERDEGLDRRIINDQLLRTMESNWNISSSATTKFGIIGHSLGSGTVFSTGNDDWVRISIAGFPRNGPNGQDAMFISSVNDGAVPINRIGGKQVFTQANYPFIDDTILLNSFEKSSNNFPHIPSRCTIFYEGNDAPNHISFLSESVNNAMIDFLSPLLPVAQNLKIPVLDFDKYQMSRDSVYTARKTHPIIIQYLKQQMKLV